MKKTYILLVLFVANTICFKNVICQENTATINIVSEEIKDLSNEQLLKALHIADSIIIESKQIGDWEKVLYYSNYKAEYHFLLQQFDEAITHIDSLILCHREVYDSLSEEFLKTHLLLDDIYEASSRNYERYLNSEKLWQLCEQRNKIHKIDYLCYIRIAVAQSFFRNKQIAIPAILKAIELNSLYSYDTDKNLTLNLSILSYNFRNRKFAYIYLLDAINNNQFANIDDSINYIVAANYLVRLMPRDIDLDEANYYLDQEKEMLHALSENKNNYAKLKYNYLKDFELSTLARYYNFTENIAKSDSCCLVFQNKMFCEGKYEELINSLIYQGRYHGEHWDIETSKVFTNKARFLYDSLNCDMPFYEYSITEDLAILNYYLSNFNNSVSHANSGILKIVGDSSFFKSALSLPADTIINNYFFNKYLLSKTRCLIELYKENPDTTLQEAMLDHLDYFHRTILNGLKPLNYESEFYKHQILLQKVIYIYINFFALNNNGIDSSFVINKAINFKSAVFANKLSEINSHGLQQALSQTKNELEANISQYQIKRKNNLPIDSVLKKISNSQNIVLKTKYDLNKSQNLKSKSNFQFNKNIAQVQGALNQHEIIFDYVLTNNRVLISCITKDSYAFHISNSDTIYKLCDFMIKDLRAGNINIKNSQSLYNILIKPFSKMLADKQKLIVMSDNSLSLVPFDILQNNGRLLVEDYSIVSMPSVPIWYQMRTKNEKNQELKPLTFLGIAPVYAEGNNKLASNQVLRSIFYEDTLITRNGGSMRSLPNTHEEVDAIYNIFRKDSISKALLLLSNDATKTNVVKNLNNYSIVHFATHGFVDKKNSSISGLTLFPDSEEFTYQDILYHYELYSQKLNANLVVLSACKTGIGEVVPGEWVMALPRGFIYAGVPNVIASLWKVHDEKTKDLMVAFYKHLLEDKVSYAEALRLAKLDCIEKGFLPMDWAGFVLIGN